MLRNFPLFQGSCEDSPVLKIFSSVVPNRWQVETQDISNHYRFPSHFQVFEDPPNQISLDDFPPIFCPYPLVPRERASGSCGGCRSMRTGTPSCPNSDQSIVCICYNLRWTSCAFLTHPLTVTRLKNTDSFTCSESMCLFLRPILSCTILVYVSTTVSLNRTTYSQLPMHLYMLTIYLYKFHEISLRGAKLKARRLADRGLHI